MQDHLFNTEDDLESVLRQARGRLRKREIAERERVRRKVQNGYDTGAEQDWAELLGGVEPQVSLEEGGLLEAAGTSSYIAVEPTQPLRFAAAHIQHFAYTHAALCTANQISRADTSNCLTQQTGTVTDRAEESNADTTSYTVTVTTTGGQHKTWDVDESFHDGAQPNTGITINSYNGTIVTLTHGTLTADVAESSTVFLSWKQVVAPLALMTAAAIPLIAVGDRFFRSIKIFGLLPIAAIWNVFLAMVTFNNAGPES
ncbi:hypothetical protein ACFW2D_28810 [Streptomyces sp. NPDC058914]|uniref:hypothetical protein n=1 Tax=Streptomyces TaxID=1883 RepID=UPI0036D0A705